MRYVLVAITCFLTLLLALMPPQRMTTTNAPAEIEHRALWASETTTREYWTGIDYQERTWEAQIDTGRLLVELLIVLLAGAGCYTLLAWREQATERPFTRRRQRRRS